MSHTRISESSKAPMSLRSTTRSSLMPPESHRSVICRSMLFKSQTLMSMKPEMRRFSLSTIVHTPPSCPVSSSDDFKVFLFHSLIVPSKDPLKTCLSLASSAQTAFLCIARVCEGTISTSSLPELNSFISQILISPSSLPENSCPPTTFRANTDFTCPASTCRQVQPSVLHTQTVLSTLPLNSRSIATSSAHTAPRCRRS
mmetsp:Transcript_7414/g.25337  ORF Transcript_7414/g.25337 Transcript_7414/m.25337 type:complete len:200 (+) Transcript_7414:190-789(+)